MKRFDRLCGRRCFPASLDDVHSEISTINEKEQFQIRNLVNIKKRWLNEVQGVKVAVLLGRFRLIQMDDRSQICDCTWNQAIVFGTCSTRVAPSCLHTRWLRLISSVLLFDYKSFSAEWKIRMSLDCPLEADCVCLCHLCEKREFGHSVVSDYSICSRFCRIAERKLNIFIGTFTSTGMSVTLFVGAESKAAFKSISIAYSRSLIANCMAWSILSWRWSPGSCTPFPWSVFFRNLSCSVGMTYTFPMYLFSFLVSKF